MKKRIKEMGWRKRLKNRRSGVKIKSSGWFNEIKIYRKGRFSYENIYHLTMRNRVRVLTSTLTSE